MILGLNGSRHGKAGSQDMCCNEAFPWRKVAITCDFYPFLPRLSHPIAEAPCSVKRRCTHSLVEIDFGLTEW